MIEDAAQAIGAECRINGSPRKVGSMGTFGCFSFFPSKNLGGIGDGGIITVQDPELASVLRLKRVHGGEKNTTTELSEEISGWIRSRPR